MNSESNSKRRENPRQNAGIASVLTYFWTIPIFWKGLQRELSNSDLFKPLKEHASCRLGDKLESAWRKETQAHQEPSLWRALGRVFGPEFLANGIIYIVIELVLKISQPLALLQLLSLYNSENSANKHEIFIYAGIIVIAAFLNCVLINWYTLNLHHLGMKIRIACSSVVYRKALTLNKNEGEGISVGRVINLLSNDVSKFDRALINLHPVWFVPIQTAVVAYVLFEFIGLIPAIGVLFLVSLAPLQIYLGKKQADLRVQIAQRTDKRVNLVSETISGIRLIKMNAWENNFNQLIDSLRKAEMDKILTAAYIKGMIISFYSFTSRVAVFLVAVIYVLLGNTLSAEYIFVTSAFYNVMRQSVSRYYPLGISQFGEAAASVARLQKFLLEQTCLEKAESTRKFNEIGVFLEKASAKWCSASLDSVLSNITLSIRSGEAVAVTGPVGSGKTALLNLIMRNLFVVEGQIDVRGKLSYAPQEPWIFPGTIKQNIIFARTMDPERYQKVIDVCSLGKDLSLFPSKDDTIVGEGGLTLSGGQRARVGLARAVYNDADIYLLDDPLSAVDNHVGKRIFEKCILEFLRGKCVILVTHQLQYLKHLDRIIWVDKGKIVTSGNFQKVYQTAGIDFNENTSKLPTEELSHETDVSAVHETPHKNKEEEIFENLSKNVYMMYLKSGKSLLTVFAIILFNSLNQTCLNGCDYFLAYWVSVEENNSYQSQSLSKDTYIYIYTAIVLSLIALNLIKPLVFYAYFLRCATKLHKNMLDNIIQTPIQFFLTNSSGKILNRFSADMGVIDEVLPTIIYDSLQMTVAVIGTIIVISIVYSWLLIPSGLVVLALYLVQKIYTPTSKSVRHLERTTRSPIYTHVNASLEGITTIRVFGAENILQKEFDNILDVHTSAGYLFLSCSTAFGFWLDFICVVFLAAITFGILIMGSENHGGYVGLVISHIINLAGIFQWGMHQWTDFDNQIAAVERVVAYSKVARETRSYKIIPPTRWPEKGDIIYSSVSLRYSPTDPYILKQLNINIRSKEKIGIVGRTGAGKSSLIHALFQLSETEGTILIDDLDIGKVPLPTLRSNISIIPQEPVMFSGNLRRNLDPLNEYADVDLWRALEEVELKAFVDAFPSGLLETLSDGGSRFSAGQKQLICLARAIVRKNRILVLDEATANLDQQTDALIQQTIKRKFVDSTVLTIAHRLNTVMSSDKVLTMSYGTVVEFDHPYLLLKSGKGLFYEMVQQAGPATANDLYNAAKNSYQANRN